MNSLIIKYILYLTELHDYIINQCFIGNNFENFISVGSNYGSNIPAINSNFDVKKPVFSENKPISINCKAGENDAAPISSRKDKFNCIIIPNQENKASRNGIVGRSQSNPNAGVNS